MAGVLDAQKKIVTEYEIATQVGNQTVDYDTLSKTYCPPKTRAIELGASAIATYYYPDNKLIPKGVVEANLSFSYPLCVVIISTYLCEEDPNILDSDYINGCEIKIRTNSEKSGGAISLFSDVCQQRGDQVLDLQTGNQRWAYMGSLAGNTASVALYRSDMFGALFGDGYFCNVTGIYDLDVYTNAGPDYSSSYFKWNLCELSNTSSIRVKLNSNTDQDLYTCTVEVDSDMWHYPADSYEPFSDLYLSNTEISQNKSLTYGNLNMQTGYWTGKAIVCWVDH